MKKVEMGFVITGVVTLILALFMMFIPDAKEAFRYVGMCTATAALSFMGAWLLATHRR